MPRAHISSMSVHTESHEECGNCGRLCHLIISMCLMMAVLILGMTALIWISAIDGEDENGGNGVVVNHSAVSTSGS